LNFRNPCVICVIQFRRSLEAMIARFAEDPQLRVKARQAFLLVHEGMRGLLAYENGMKQPSVVQIEEKIREFAFVGGPNELISEYGRVEVVWEANDPNYVLNFV
jgi:hypothetical protein